MWAQLKAQEAEWVGGALTDHDEPNQPTELLGFEFTDAFITFKGRDFDWSSARQYVGATGRSKPGTLTFETPFGMACTIAPQRSAGRHE